MCNLCTFEHGVATTKIEKQELQAKFVWEIRPNTSGGHLMFVRVFDKSDELIDKSSILIKHCPECGREL